MAFTVSDFMTRQVVTVTPEDRMRQAAERMQARGCRRLPVVEGERLVGIISDRDVRLAFASPLVMRERWYDDKLLDETPVRACMSPQVEAVSPDTSLIQVLIADLGAPPTERRT
jgi:acetoin utilization protein AcuB